MPDQAVLNALQSLNKIKYDGAFHQETVGESNAKTAFDSPLFCFKKQPPPMVLTPDFTVAFVCPLSRLPSRCNESGETKLAEMIKRAKMEIAEEKAKRKEGAE